MESQTLDSVLSPGGRFGRYVIVRAIGSGAMGTVYEARHRELGKRVALKVLHRGAALDPTLRMRFQREGQLAVRIRHPHVVDVLDVGEQDGVPFLVLEYLEGESLGVHLERLAPLDIAQIAEILVPVCAAVTAGHKAGVIHRDLKPENILLTRSDSGILAPMVVDFGISRLSAENAPALTQPHAIVGTPYYLSPEQCLGEVATEASDQFSLGVILYQCATGQRPFDGDNVLTVIVNVRECAPRPPREHRPELPAELERVILRALQATPSARFQSVQALGAALLPFGGARLQTLWSEASCVEPPSESPAPRDPLSSGSTPVPVSLRDQVPYKSRGWVLPLVVGALSSMVLAALFLSRSPTPRAGSLADGGSRVLTAASWTPTTRVVLADVNLGPGQIPDAEATRPAVPATDGGRVRRRRDASSPQGPRNPDEVPILPP